MKWFVRLHSFEAGSYVAELREERELGSRTDKISQQMERALNREMPGGQLRRHDLPKAQRVGMMASEA